MINLKKMLEDRDVAYQKSTDAVLIEMKTAIKGITVFLRNKDELKNATISWEEVTYFKTPNENNDGFVMLLGVINYPVGERFMLPNGNVVEITEEIADYFRRIIRIGLPLKLAAEGTVEQVVEFMEATMKKDEDANDPTEVETSPEFDLSELSEEQLQTLRLFSNQAGKKN